MHGNYFQYMYRYMYIIKLLYCYTQSKSHLIYKNFAPRQKTCTLHSAAYRTVLDQGATAVIKEAGTPTLIGMRLSTAKSNDIIMTLS